MNNKKGFISISTIVTLIIGILGILLVNLAIVSSRINLFKYIKDDVRDSIKELNYPICKWSASTAMVIPKEGGDASNSIHVICTSLNGINFNNYSYSDSSADNDLSNKKYVKEHLDTIFNSIIDNPYPDQIKVSYLSVYKVNFGYRIVFGITSSTTGEYKIKLKSDIVNNGLKSNNELQSNKILVVNE